MSDIRGIKAQNRVVRIEKMQDGSIRAFQANGNTFVASDELVKAFIVYTMIYAEELAA